MLQKTITWINPFTEEEESGEFYFHLKKEEIIQIEMDYAADEGIAGHFQKLGEAGDTVGIYNAVRKLILAAYGVKEGTKHRKSPELTAEFEDSEAFGEILLKTATDAELAAEFVNGIMPKGLEQNLDEIRVKFEKAQAKAEKDKAKAEAKKA